MYQMIFCLQPPRTYRVIEIKKEMLVSVIATSLKPLEIKIWTFSNVLSWLRGLFNIFTLQGLFMYLNVNKNTSNFFCVLETSKPLGLERILLPNEMT